VLTTRVAVGVDVAAVARLWTASNIARRAELGLPLGPVPGADAAESEREVRRRLADPGNFAMLLVEDGEPIAMTLVMQALAQDGASPDPVPGLAHVSMVAVRPDRWGRGLGALALYRAQAEAATRGYTRGQLWTHETNRRARRLYARLGWVESGRTKIDDHGERIRHYVRDL
jgi:GNAT superfamily N-acetyltransferase